MKRKYYNFDYYTSNQEPRINKKIPNIDRTSDKKLNDIMTNPDPTSKDQKKFWMVGHKICSTIIIGRG